MGSVYKVRSSPAAKVIMGLRKQAIVEDAVKRAEAASKGQDLLAVLQVNALPLKLIIQPKQREIDIVTDEEAEQSGVMKLPDVRMTDRN
jgi:hypothetical protein